MAGDREPLPQSVALGGLRRLVVCDIEALSSSVRREKEIKFFSPQNTLQMKLKLKPHVKESIVYSATSS